MIENLEALLEESQESLLVARDESQAGQYDSAAQRARAVLEKLEHLVPEYQNSRTEDNESIRENSLVSWLMPTIVSML